MRNFVMIFVTALNRDPDMLALVKGDADMSIDYWCVNS